MLYHKHCFSPTKGQASREESLLVDSGVGETCQHKRLMAFDARATLATMHVSALVAAPCFGVVDAQLCAPLHDLRLRQLGVGRHNLHADIGSGLRGVADGPYESRTAVGIDGVVATMVGDEHLLQFVALSNARRDGEHDAIAEGHHGGAHVVVRIVALGNVAGPREERTLEIVVHESQGYRDMLDTQAFAVQTGEGNLPRIVVGTIVERDRQRYLLRLVIEQRDGVESTTHNNHRIFHRLQR